MNAAAKQPALTQATLDFLAREHKLFINGVWVQSSGSETIDIINPSTEEVITKIQAGTRADIDKAVVAAQAALKGEWAALSSRQRGKVLMRFADLIDENLQTLAELEVLDNGQPLMIAQYTVAGFGADFVRYYAGWCDKIEGATIPVSPAEAPAGGSLTYTKREPIGVVGAIIPWNAPIAMAILKIAPSLAAGCTIILKPAELAPLTSMKLADIAKEAGVPDGVFNVVNGTGPEVGAALSEHMNIQKVSFTGSTGVGQTIAKAAAGSNLKKVTLELGGKSPVVVFPDANMEKVIPSICRAAFFLQGQNCMAGTRLLVHKDVADAVIEGVVAALAFWKVGDGFQPDALIGPLISATQRDRVMSFIEAGKAEGARLVTGGNAVGDKGYFVEPTVFADCKPDMTIVQEEIFGPVLSVLTFDTYDLDEIAQLANDNVYGLSGSVWTQDISRAHKLVSMIDSGQVSINCHAAVDPAIPFGGNKMSGWGREFGKEGLEPFLKTKATTVVF